MANYQYANTTKFRELGVVRVNPLDYVQKYGTTLKAPVELPEFVKQIKPLSGVELAADCKTPSLFELEGDVDALKLIDLDSEGLGEYRDWFNRFLNGNNTDIAPATTGSAGLVTQNKTTSPINTTQQVTSNRLPSSVTKNTTSNVKVDPPRSALDKKTVYVKINKPASSASMYTKSGNPALFVPKNATVNLPKNESISRNNSELISSTSYKTQEKGKDTTSTGIAYVTGNESTPSMSSVMRSSIVQVADTELAYKWGLLNRDASLHDDESTPFNSRSTTAQENDNGLVFNLNKENIKRDASGVSQSINGDESVASTVCNTPSFSRLECDLDHEGLKEYKEWIQRFNGDAVRLVTPVYANSTPHLKNGESNVNKISTVNAAVNGATSSSSNNKSSVLKLESDLDRKRMSEYKSDTKKFSSGISGSVVSVPGINVLNGVSNGVTATASGKRLVYVVQNGSVPYASENRKVNVIGNGLISGQKIIQVKENRAAPNVPGNRINHVVGQRNIFQQPLLSNRNATHEAGIKPKEQVSNSSTRNFIENRVPTTGIGYSRAVESTSSTACNTPLVLKVEGDSDRQGLKENATQLRRLPINVGGANPFATAKTVANSTNKESASTKIESRIPQTNGAKLAELRSESTRTTVNVKKIESVATASASNTAQIKLDELKSISSKDNAAYLRGSTSSLASSTSSVLKSKTDLEREGLYDYTTWLNKIYNDLGESNSISKNDKKIEVPTSANRTTHGGSASYVYRNSTANAQVNNSSSTLYKTQSAMKLQNDSDRKGFNEYKEITRRLTNDVNGLASSGSTKNHVESGSSLNGLNKSLAQSERFLAGNNLSNGNKRDIVKINRYSIHGDLTPSGGFNTIEQSKELIKSDQYEQVLSKLKTSLGKSYSREELNELIKTIDQDNDDALSTKLLKRYIKNTIKSL